MVSSDYPLEDQRANGLVNFICGVDFIREKNYNGVYVSYKNKGELSGKEFGQDRAQQAKMNKANKEKELDESVTEGEQKVKEAKEKVKQAREKLEKDKKEKKIKDKEYNERKTKIDKAEQAANELEAKVEKEKAKKNKTEEIAQ